MVAGRLYCGPTMQPASSSTATLPEVGKSLFTMPPPTGLNGTRSASSPY